MPQNNNKKKKVNELTQLVKQELGDTLTHEIRDLIDAAVRRQWDTQQFFQRVVNTKYFRQKFPGLIEQNGTIANGLTGQQGASVSASTLGQAIAHYRTALDQTQQLAQTYGYHNFGKDQFAKLLQDETSPDEFKARLAAVETVDANPQLKEAYEAQLRASGQKVTGNAAYKAALSMGDKGFLNLYEGAQYQTQLGLSREEAAAAAKSSPVEATQQSLDQVVAFARQNLQSIGPELQAQGITTPQLVKILNNPSAYAADIDKIKNIQAQRQAQFGRPVPGTYGQQGQGGLSQYPQQREQSYG